MTKERAIELLKAAPRGNSTSATWWQPEAISQKEAVRQVEKLVSDSANYESDGALNWDVTYKVIQVNQNVRRPTIPEDAYD